MDNVYPFSTCSLLDYQLNFLVGVGNTNSQHYYLLVVVVVWGVRIGINSKNQIERVQG
jgi:steroid 5-alpha reductase family enzyme